MIFGMEWLYLNRTKVDCQEKDIGCSDDNGKQIILQGKKKATSVRIMTYMQEKCSHRKECVLFAVHISSDKGKHVDDEEVLSRYPILQ